MSEKLCLKWNDFQENVNTAFGNLRKDTEFADVTLASEDGEQIEAHKIVLASSSPFFKNLLKKNNHPHPIIYMKGVKFDHLSAIVDFLYFGETRIFQENLENFLALAEELKLKGLTGGNEKNVHVQSINNSSKSKKKRSSPQTVQPIEDVDQKHNLLKEPIPSLKEAVTMELDEQIESMTCETDKTNPMRSGKIFACKVCEKEGSRKDITRHVESKHITGISHNCEICGKSAR